MNKIIIATVIFFACLTSVLSQSVPQKINYQAVAHDASGNALANTTISADVSIISGSPTGTVEYSENHSVSTNEYGLFYFKIGAGVVSSGSFNNIQLPAGDHFLNVVVNGEDLGTTQLVSVPYALVSRNTIGLNGNAISNTVVADGDVLVFNGVSGQWEAQAIGSTAETTTTLVDNANGTFTYTNELGSPVTFDANIPDGDDDGTNELITSFSINTTKDSLFLEDAGGSYVVALGSAGAGVQRINDADNNTYVETEQTTNDDIIRFGQGGTEFFNMNNGHLNVENTGGSVFIGFDAGLNDNMVFTDNVFVGNVAGTANTSGSQNVAVGAESMFANTTGFGNTALGYRSFDENTSGNENTAIGGLALGGNTTGSQNSAVGRNTLGANTIGFENTAMGIGAMSLNTNGVQNTSFGASSGSNITTGSSGNLFLGYNANSSVSTINNSSAIGAGATVDIDNAMVLGNNVNVGIGTSSPANKLEVVGDAVKFDSVIIVNGANAGYVLTSDAAGNASWQASSAPAGFWSGTTGAVYPTTLTDDVGIGTTTPVSELDVMGNARLNDGKLMLGPVGGVNSGYTGVYEDASDLKLAVFKPASPATNFGTNSIDAMTIKSNTGFVGVGTTAPNNKLEVVGDAAKFDSVIIVNGANAGYLLTSDAAGNASWQAAPAGAFVTTGNVTSNSPGDLTNDDFLFGSTTLTDDTDPNHDSRMFFDKSKSAFRAGNFDAGDADANVGLYSFATGLATQADGDGSVAMGTGTNALGNNSVAMGVAANANGNGSIAIGTSMSSTGDNSVSIGTVNNATAQSSVAIGQQVTTSGANSIGIGTLNSVSGNSTFGLGRNLTLIGDNAVGIGTDNEVNAVFSSAYGDHLRTSTYAEQAFGYYNTQVFGSTSTYVPTDRLLSIGNGNAGLRSDALVILKNGATTINGPLTIDGDNVAGAGTSYTLPAQDGGANSVLQTDGAGSVTWAAIGGAETHIQDGDADTFIEADAGGIDADIISFNMGDAQGYTATEYFRMNGPRLDVLNSGNSVFIGENAGASDDLSGNNNTFIGAVSGQANTTGTNNLFLGYASGSTNTVGTNNIALGSFALDAATTTNNNIAIGFGSQGTNTTGSENVAIGTNSNGGASVGPMTGGQNTAVGHGALYVNETGNGNVAMGLNSLVSNTTGAFNTAVGYGAGATNDSGSSITTIGNGADVGTSNLNNATAIGANATVDANNSLILGDNAKVGIGTSSPSADLHVLDDGGGESEVKIQSITSAQTSVLSFERANAGETVISTVNTLGSIKGFGYDGTNYSEGARIVLSADGTIGTGSVPGRIEFRTTAVGNTTPTKRMVITNAGDIGIGTITPAAKLDISGTVKITDGTEGAGKVLTSDAVGNASWQSVGSGPETLIQDSDADTYINLESSPDEDIIHFNIGDAQGYPAGEYFRMNGPTLETVNPSFSVFVGEGAGFNDDLTSNQGVFIGYFAGGANTTGQSNVGVGMLALGSNTTGGANTAVGGNTLGANVTGTGNTAIGFSSQQASTGDQNTSVGNGSLNANSSGYENTAVGSFTLSANTSGFNNAALGRLALGQSTTGNYNTGIGQEALYNNTTGSNNTAIGAFSGTASSGLTNTTAIGYNVLVSQSNSVVLGNNADVGIGTTAPAAKLDVIGSVKITDGTEGVGKVLTSDAAGNATWKPKKVAFYAGHTAILGGTVPSNTTTDVIFPITGTGYFNDGGGYNSATGAFTPPVPGVYQINSNLALINGTPGALVDVILTSSSGFMSRFQGEINAFGELTVPISVTCGTAEFTGNWKLTVFCTQACEWDNWFTNFSGTLIYAY